MRRVEKRGRREGRGRTAGDEYDLPVQIRDLLRLELLGAAEEKHGAVDEFEAEGCVFGQVARCMSFPGTMVAARLRRE